MRRQAYDLEYAEGIKEKFSARSAIAKWKKHLKELEAAEALLNKVPAPKK